MIGHTLLNISTVRKGKGGRAQRGRKSLGVEKGRVGGRIPKGEELGINNKLHQHCKILHTI